MNNRIESLDNIREEYSNLFKAIASFNVIKEDIAIVLSDFFEKLDSTVKKIYIKKLREDFVSYRDAYIKELDSLLSEVFRRWEYHNAMFFLATYERDPMYFSLEEISTYFNTESTLKLDLNLNLGFDEYRSREIVKISGNFLFQPTGLSTKSYELENLFSIEGKNFNDLKCDFERYLTIMLNDNSWNYVEGFIDSFSLAIIGDFNSDGCEKIKWLGSVSEFARLFFDLASNAKIEFPFSSHAEDQSNWLFAKQLLQAFDIRKSDGKPVEVNYLRTALDRARDKETYKR